MASFRNVYTSLLLVMAGSTDRELARQVNYLKAENQILCSRLPGRISLTEREKNRLGELKKLGIESVTRNTVKNILKRNLLRTFVRDRIAKDSVGLDRRSETR